MAGLTAVRILRAWERGIGRNAYERAIDILAEAESDVSTDELAALPIGEVEKRLLAIRQATFGRRFCARFSCPACSERLEFHFSSDDFRDTESSNSNSEPAPLHIGEFALELRLPNSADLGLAARCTGVEAARQLLARRCVNKAYLHGAVIAAEEVPDSLIGDIAQHLETSDPVDEKTLEITCPSCEARSQSRFDIASFFWAEIEAEALHLFRDIHCLARGYGWREVDILAMTPMRRRVYLEMLQHE
jgi:hypothetical protein